MELRQYFSVVWKWLWLIVLSTVIAGGASYYATYQQPKIYQSAATVLVGTSIQSERPSTGDLAISGYLAQTYTQIARTMAVSKATIDALGIPMSPEQLRGSISASPVQGTQLIIVRVTDTNPDRAQLLANEVAHQLTLQGPAASEAERQKQREFVQKQVQDLQNKIEGAQKSIVELQDSIQITSSAREIADKQQQITTLQNQIGQWQNSYGGLINFLTPQSPNYLSIIEPAQRPSAPIGPNIPLNVSLAAGVGFILALGAAFLLEYLDDTIKTPDDVMRYVDLSPVGTIAKIEGKPNEKLVTATAPRHSIAEAYRVLRTNIQFSGVDKPIKSILVTSAGPEEGKSVTAANLAVVMAQAGLRTILVDADLRKPSQHKAFGFTNDVGLTNSLLSKNSLDGFVRPTRIENLKVLTAGPLPPNPSEVLASERMRRLKEQLEGSADILVFDSPPAIPVTDAAILSRMVDGVLIVVDSAHTHRDSLVRAKEILEKIGGRVLGVVLNRISRRGHGYRYYNYDYYSVESKPGKPPTGTSVQRTPVLARLMRR